MSLVRVNRCPSGIEGFDELIEGGFPRGSLSLITGTPGTAKTLFGLQFIVNGARDHKEKGMFISFDQTTENLCRQLGRFNYDLQKYIDKGLVEIVELSNWTMSADDPYSKLMNKKFVARVSKFEPKRVVLDSISLVTQMAKSNIDTRRAVREVSNIFKYLKTTTLFTHERKASAMGDLEYSIEEFLADGIVHLQLHLTEDFLDRFLSVIKMRETNQNTGIHKFTINEKGIYVRH